MTINGSCFCGSITYKVEGKLRNARSCHCSECRKAFSAQASAYAQVDPDGFSWVSGESLLTSYESKKGEGLQFCSICGSTLRGTYKGRINGVTLGCVDVDPEISLGMHIFVGSKASWETIPKGVPQYEEGPPVTKPGKRTTRQMHSDSKKSRSFVALLFAAGYLRRESLKSQSYCQCNTLDQLRSDMTNTVETSTPANTPNPIGPYNHIAKVGQFISIGGTAGVNPATGQLAGSDVYSQAKQIIESFEVMLRSVGSDSGFWVAPQPPRDTESLPPARRPRRQSRWPYGLLLSAYSDPEFETDLKPCFASHGISGTQATFNLTGETKPSGFTVSTELIVMGKAQLNPLSRSAKIIQAEAYSHGLHSGVAVGDKKLF